MTDWQWDLQNGEITDPPPFETTSDVRYAQSIQRPESPVFTTPDEALFCPTCIKNQHLLTQSLAAYLPSPIDPNYATYEASYPGYRKGLEERYPQVCEDCEPRVRERIRATGYAAKTDHLRRMMEKSRGASRSQSRWDWRRFVVLMGAIMWWTSLAGQMQWNLIGAVATGSELDGLREFNASTSLPDCLWQSLQTGEAKHECVELAGSLTGLAVILGLLSIWWNPCLSAKIKGKGGRMVGLSAFYNFQAVGNGLRLVQWYLLGHSTDLRLNGQITKALHAFMLVFNTLVRLNYDKLSLARTDTSNRLCWYLIGLSEWTILLESRSRRAMNHSLIEPVPKFRSTLLEEHRPHRIRTRLVLRHNRIEPHFQSVTSHLLHNKPTLLRTTHLHRHQTKMN